MQAFKIIVTDPDTVLSTLTREVKEVGPDGQEVYIFIRVKLTTSHNSQVLFMTKYIFCCCP